MQDRTQFYERGGTGSVPWRSAAHKLGLAGLSVLGLLLVPGKAFSYTIQDGTETGVDPLVMANPSGDTSEFHINSIDIVKNGGNPNLLDFTVTTNFPKLGITEGHGANTWKTLPADLAIGTSFDFINNKPVYDYGVALTNHNNADLAPLSATSFNSGPLSEGHLYKVGAGGANWDMSDNFNPHGFYTPNYNPLVIQGGYYGNQEVAIGAGAVDKGGATPVWSPTSPANPEGNNTIKFTVNTTGFGGGWNPNLPLFIHLASATCANDYINGAIIVGNLNTPVTGAGVPEPSTYAMVGLAMIGLLVVGRRKKLQDMAPLA